jgi:hypothetical protein
MIIRPRHVIVFPVFHALYRPNFRLRSRLFLVGPPQVVEPLAISGQVEVIQRLGPYVFGGQNAEPACCPKSIAPYSVSFDPENAFSQAEGERLSPESPERLGICRGPTSVLGSMAPLENADFCRIFLHAHRPQRRIRPPLLGNLAG